MKRLVNDPGQPEVYTITDMSKAMGRSISSVWSRIRLFSTLPAPEIRVGRRDYYSATTFEEIVTAERMRRSSKAALALNNKKESACSVTRAGGEEDGVVVERKQE
jgi:hypothetical protein